jgi:DNA replication protein DnaC
VEVVGMSNTETYERIHNNMIKLRMYTAESVIDTQLEHAASNESSITEVLDQILDIEVKARKASAVEACTRLSGFPVKKTLDEFDLTYQPSIDKSVFDDIRSLRFIHNSENLGILGPPGTGKTHIAIGLGMEAIKAGYSVYYMNAVQMIDKLKKANHRGTLDRALKTLGKYKLLIVDEIGYLPMDREGAHLFFQMVSRRYEKGSTIFTSNKTYSEWGEILGDNVIASAVLDRILHHSITLNIKGESYRLKARRRAGLPVPPPVMEA